MAEILKQEIEGLKLTVQVETSGIITEIGDGVAKVWGLSQAQAGEMIDFGSGRFGLALNLAQDEVGIILLSDERGLKAGQRVKTTGRILSVPVGPALLGRVVNPLGQPLDDAGAIKTDQISPVEKAAPGVIERQSVNTPLQTGIKAIDAMIPIGRGQRELIIGDRQTGKTALAIDTIINQTRINRRIKENKLSGLKPVYSIYVAIGQQRSRVAKIIDRLEREGAMEWTVVVVTSAADPASLQYLAPYAGSSIGEFFRDRGDDALIVYDDLSKHAWAYRQISLLLKRPPGREAYPGDVFYLHSRLLERSAKLSDKNSGGSLTALPIIETQAGDISAYIPTNVISITDGQIFLENDLFYQGIRPAVSVGLSVSRVGGTAQIKAMKQVAGQLRLQLAQFRELAAFAQFATDLDPQTKQQIERGKRMTELLKQLQYQPEPIGLQVVKIYAVINGYFDSLPVEQVKLFEQKLADRLATDHSKLLDEIEKTGQLSPTIENKIKQIVSQITPKQPANQDGPNQAEKTDQTQTTNIDGSARSDTSI